MVKSKGFEVALRSNGHDLNEHPVPQTNPHKIVRYVDAAPGTQFAVRYRLPSDRDPRENKTFSGWLISVYADGEYVTSQLRQGSQRDGSIDGNPVYNNGLLAVQKMQFARTAVDFGRQISREDLEDEKDWASHLGVVKVTFRRSKRAHRFDPAVESQSPPFQFSEETKSVHERARYSIRRPLSVRFTEPQSTNMPPLGTADAIDDDDDPCLTFKFRIVAREEPLGDNASMTPQIIPSRKLSRARVSTTALPPSNQMTQNERPDAGNDEKKRKREVSPDNRDPDKRIKQGKGEAYAGPRDAKLALGFLMN
ncbi:hypothetical protein MMC10_010536 [Thelotrema lepadinum]|nr:hypothetical protein [Thelotrema lepadinum]